MVVLLGAAAPKLFGHDRIQSQPTPELTLPGGPSTEKRREEETTQAPLETEDTAAISNNKHVTIADTESKKDDLEILQERSRETIRAWYDLGRLVELSPYIFKASCVTMADENRIYTVKVNQSFRGDVTGEIKMKSSDYPLTLN